MSRKRRLQSQLLGHARLRLLVRKWHIYSLATRPQQCEQESRATTPLAQTRVEEPGTGIVTRLRQKCVEQELEMHRLNLELRQHRRFPEMIGSPLAAESRHHPYSGR